MKKTKILILTVILSVIFLGIEIIIVRKAAHYEPKRNVVYASTDVKAGEIIKEEMLKEKETEISNIHEHSFQEKEDIIGKIARTDLFKGEMILAERLYDQGEAEEILALNKNSRLFTVEFKGDQVNGWWLKEGQYVDIIFVPNEKTQKGNFDVDLILGIEAQRPYGMQKIKNVRIAAIIDDKGNLIRDDVASSTPKYISFEVDEELDEFLAYAKGNGRLELSVIPIMLDQ